MRAFLELLSSSPFRVNILWTTSHSIVERLAAVLQTILLARALGIDDYGAYGLLAGTIGFVASIVGLQMGLTATIFISRYKVSDTNIARRVIQYTNMFALIVSGALLIVALPIAGDISIWLFYSPGFGSTVSLACLLVIGSVISGAQIGIVHGFEDFRSVARISVLCSLGSVMVIYPATIKYGLDGCFFVLVTFIFVKCLMVYRVAAEKQSQFEFPKNGSGVSFFSIISAFSVPSMLTSVIVGGISWLGLFLLSRQNTGLHYVALATVALQWKSPLLLVVSSIGKVAIPTYSRLFGSENSNMSAIALQRKISVVVGLGAIIVATLVSIFSRQLLSFYGSEFVPWWTEFSIIVASAIAQVLVNVSMQGLVGKGQMWKVFYLHVPYFVIASIGYFICIPRYGLFGYAMVMMCTAILFWLYVSVYNIFSTKMRIS